MALSKDSMNALRAQSQKVHGVNCKVCGSDRHPQLHHVNYMAGVSDYRRSGGQYAHTRRLRESISHPENFVLLCAGCHTAIETMIPRLLKLTPQEATRLVGVMNTTVKNRRGREQCEDE